MLDPDLKKQLMTLLDDLENRAGMLMYEQNYHAVVNYLLGYEKAIFDSQQEEIFSDFQIYINEKLGGDVNLHWSYAIPHLIEIDEKKAPSMLFRLLRECFDDIVKPYLDLPGPAMN